MSEPKIPSPIDMLSTMETFHDAEGRCRSEVLAQVLQQLEESCDAESAPHLKPSSTC